MPIVDGCYVVCRLRPVSPARRKAIAAGREAARQRRAQWRAMLALDKLATIDAGPPTAEERERYRELSVALSRAMADIELDEAAGEAVERQLLAWMRSAAPRMPWYKFVAAMKDSYTDQAAAMAQAGLEAVILHPLGRGTGDGGRRKGHRLLQGAEASLLMRSSPMMRKRGPPQPPRMPCPSP